MRIQQQFEAQGVEMTRVEDDDRVELVADFGPGTDVAVDVVDETAIVVAGDEQYDIDVPEDAQAFITNGVLTIEVNR